MLIDSDKSSEDSDHHRFDTVKLMESENPMIRFVIYGKIKKMINSYRGTKLKEIDKRLLRGLFIKNLKDFDED